MKRLPKRDKAKELFWRKALVRFAKSGLSQSAFCKREGLNPNNFYWWKRTILERDTVKGAQSAHTAENPFVPVMPRADDHREPQENSILVAEFDLATRTVRIFKGADADTLRALIAVLRDSAR